VVIGIADSWGQSIPLPGTPHDGSYTWSPCSRFVAAFADEDVEIRDAFSSELVTTLTGSVAHPGGKLAYSPDGRLLAHLSGALIIWDIQTGGIAEKVQCYESYPDSMVWSLDGRTIGITKGSAVHVYHVGRYTMRSVGTLQSHSGIHLWAHSGSFRTMATGLDGQVFTIEIFEVGSDLTKIESFHIESWGQDHRIESFSPTTYRISIRVRNQLRVLDIRNSECLLEEEGGFSHCFSSDGSLFAARQHPNNIHIWKYTSSSYTPWRKFRIQAFRHLPLQFSPNLSSILGCFRGVLQVHRLDGRPIVTRPDSHTPLAVISHCGTYMITGHHGNDTITITNLLSKTPQQLVDTDMEVVELAITGNILLVLDSGTITAWKLTEEGAVEGVPAGRRVGRGNSIWTVSIPDNPKFTIKDRSVTIEGMGKVIHVYQTASGLGEGPEPAQARFHNSEYSSRDMYCGRHYLHYRRAGKEALFPEDNWPAPLVGSQVVWVKDPEGRHRLWVPFEWRAYSAGWLYNIATLWLDCGREGVVIVKF